MYKFGLVVIAVASVTLSACSVGVRGEQILGRAGSPMWFKTASQATIVNHYKDSCSSYGFADGTQSMANCLQNEITSAKARATSRSNTANSINAFRRSTVTCQTTGTITNCW
jgi:hypothetical protein